LAASAPTNASSARTVPNSSPLPSANTFTARDMFTIVVFALLPWPSRNVAPDDSTLFKVPLRLAPLGPSARVTSDRLL
jgi:hypothetical protein